MRRAAIVALVLAACLAVGVACLPAATGSWVRVHHPALVGGGSLVFIRDLLAPSSGNPWLAVGYLVDSEGDREPSAWTSGDGVSWTRSTLPPTSSPERRDGPFLVARRGALSVALGERFEGQPRTAAWFSSAPNAWTAVTDPTDRLLSYTGRIMALDAGPFGFVAVGFELIPRTARVTVFTSADDRSWQERGAIEPSIGFEPLGVSAASGRIVIVGDTAAGELDGDIWTLEADNAPFWSRWSRVAPGPLGLDGPGIQLVTSVAWNAEHGYVAGGSITRAGTESPPCGGPWTG